MTAEEYIDFGIETCTSVPVINFDIETCTSIPVINFDEVNWRVSLFEKSVSEYFRKQSEVSDIEEVPSNDDDDDGNEYVDKSEEKIITYKALTILVN